MENVSHNNKLYLVSNEIPKNGDLVITDNYGVWEFKNEGFGSAPIPYWANKNTCKKLVESI